MVLCLLVVSGLCAAPRGAWAAPICTTLSTGSASVGDVFINSADPDTNFSSLQEGFTGVGKHNAINDTLMHIDVSFIPPGSTVTSATVTLKQLSDSISGAEVDVHNVLAGWNPTTVTWDTFAVDFAPSITSSFSTLAGSGNVSFDLTALTQAWVNGTTTNFGILLNEATGLTSFDFSQAENLTIFSVCYTPTAHPSLALQKTVSTSGICPGNASVSVAPGTAVTSCYAVTNTGNTTITGVVVTDGAVSIPIGTLGPGATGSGSATATATVTSDTAGVASGSSSGTSVSSAPSAALITVLTSSLSLTKTVSVGGTCPGASSAAVESGLSVTYCYAVTNNGGLAVSNISVSDAGVVIPIGNLAPGASGSGATSVVIVADTDTPAVASGTDSTGATVRSTESDVVVTVVSSSLGLDPSCQSSGVNDTINNPGYPNHQVGTCASGEGYTLSQALTACGASVNYFDYTCTDFADGTRSWTAVFGCCTAAGGPSCSDGIKNGTETDVDCGGQCPQACNIGQHCTYGSDCISDYCVGGLCQTPSVLNSNCLSDGNNVTLYSSGFPNHQDGTCDGGFEGFTIFEAAGNCPSGQVKYFDYTCTDFAMPPGYSPQRTWESDYACCQVAAPSLVVVKTVSTTGACPGVPSVTVLPGTPVVDCYAVTNTGNTEVDNVVVVDNGFTVTIGNLAPGASGNGSRDEAPTSSEDTPAVAQGTSGGTQVVSPPSDASVIVVSPSLTITKTESTSGSCPGTPSVTVLSGTTVTTCYTVTNSGDTTVTGVTVTDQNGTTITVGTLGPGQSDTVSSSAPATSDSDTSATASGTVPATGTSVTSPPSDASIIVVNPSLTVTKTESTNGTCPGAPSVTVISGTTVTTCYTVTNTGDTTVTGVTVTDQNGTTLTVGTLGPGQSSTVSSSAPATSDSDTSATASGTVPATGTSVTSPPSDASIDVVSPSLSITKTESTSGGCPGAPSVTVLSGTTVTTCYTVTNTGDTTVSGITVTDTNGTTISVGDLGPGQSATVSSSSVETTSNDTPATASGTVTATGTSVTSPPSDASVVVVNPSLTVTKTESTTGACPGAPSVTVLSGTTVTTCYTVTNTGDTTVSGITVTDTNGTTISIGTLAPGQSGSGSASTVETKSNDTPATATGTVTVTGTSVTSPPSDASVVVVNPSLSIVKTVSDSGSCPGQKTVTVLVGTTVTYCYAVTNTGDTAVSGVTVNDAGTIVAVGNLGPGQTGTASSPYTALSDTTTPAVASGTVTVTGTSVSSPPDTATVDVVSPALSTTVTVSTTGACPGQKVVNVEAGTGVTWCYTVTNTGDTPVSGIVVTDNQYGVVPGAPFALNPGQSETLSLHVTASTDVTLTASAAGTATVTGTPVVSPQDSAVVHVVSPDVEIDVTVSVSGVCPGADSVTVPAGTQVTYCYVVTNNGNDVLADVNVVDAANNPIATIGDLAPGQSVTISSLPNTVQGNATVTGTANGTDIYGYPVTSTDTALVQALFASLQIQKTVSLNGQCPGVELVTVLSGTNVTYCYLVTNTGGTVVTNVVVDDNGTSVPVGTLVPGQSSVVSSSITATSDMDTFAIAAGTNPYTNKPVDSAPDDAAVVVVHPSLSIDKTVSLNGTCPGSNSVTVLPNTGVTYCYAVTNTGDTTIVNASVTDTQANVFLSVGTLAPGQEVTVSAPISVGTVNLDTFAYAAGTDSATWTHVQSNLDDAIVDVIHPALQIAVTVSTNGTCPGQKVVDVESGTGVTWCYVVTNTGDVAVNHVGASDNVYGAVPGGGGVTLGVGQSVTLSRPATISATTTITGVASGTDAVLGSSVVSNLDSAAVDVVHPKIAITVTVSTTGTCPGSPSITVPAGTGVTYCYVVTNQGDDTLDNVVVTDNSGHTITTIASLAPGASVTYTAAPPVVEMSNVTVPGNAAATDQYGFPVSASSTAIVNVLYANPGIVKTGPASVTASSSGAPLAYTLKVTNSGQTTAVGTVVTDVIPSGETYVSASTTAGSCSFASGTLTCALGNLAVGATDTITVNVSVTALTGTITNTATVTSTTPDSDSSNNTSSTTTQITNGGATRTQGFYSTHPNFLQACLTSLGGTMNIGWFVIGNYDAGGPVNNTPLAYAEGVLNANIAKYVNGVHRSSLEHDKMIAAQQLVAAICNANYLGTPPPFSLNGFIAAMAGTNDSLIMSYEAQADAFNSGGDNVNIPANPGPANPKYPWDDPTDPYM